MYNRKCYKVLNLIINGLPSIYRRIKPDGKYEDVVLNLIINGLPSILNCMLRYTAYTTKF